MRVDVAGTTVRIDGITIVEDVELAVQTAEFVGLVGPNGSGKTTLLRTIYRALRPVAGAVFVGGDDVWELHPKEAARRTAAVVQEAPSDIDFAVFEVVALGRLPHKGLIDRETRADHEICRGALERVGMADFEDRFFSTLSGGEKQRVLVARALAQQSSVLVLDEPTNHLDIRFQLELLDLIRSLGVTTIASMHDLALAADHCDRLYALKGGRVVAAGTPAEVLTADLIADVFEVAVHTVVDPETQRVLLAFDRLQPRPDGQETSEAPPESARSGRTDDRRGAP
jgi:iron complex transport system ATP-binding protein